MQGSHSGMTASTFHQKRPGGYVGKQSQLKGSQGRGAEGFKQEFASSASSLPHMGS